MRIPTRLAALLIGSLFLTGAVAAPAAIDHMDPPFWWTGMQDRHLQLMVHGPAIADLEPAIAYPGVRIAAVTRVANRNYLFIDLDIAPDTPPGDVAIDFRGAHPTRYSYRLLARSAGSAERKGFGKADAIYQLMPDRFANGDPKNDSVPALADKLDRKLGHGRHGGDIQGIIDHLDYIAGMGFTQLWPTPLVENDMPAASYHGYAATDHYRIDPRYGSNDDYVRLSTEAKKHGVGIIQDVVLSHIGLNHWWMKDLPTPDWINHNDGKFVATMHHRTAVQDPYASKEDASNFTTGWFSPGMPDMNQTNPFVANYLIQNSIWWIEYAGLSGLRIDTFGYSDGAFLAQYTQRVLAEYPHLNMVGEEWSKLPPVVAHWQRAPTSMPSMMDFPLTEAMRTALSDKNNPNVFNDVYETLSLDAQYPDASNLVLFEGNHDMARLYSVVGEDVDRWKMDLAFIMTMPRIPHFYVGDELLMTSTVGTRDDSSYRRDFPGGWAGDKVNAFTGTGLTPRQREAQDFVKKLVNWRKGAAVVHDGKLMQYGPENNTWVYFRYDGRHKVMVAFNANAKEAVLPSARFHEMLSGVAAGTDVLTGKRFDLGKEIRLPAKSVVILEL
ncbi:glycoside hydrolase family 13 protein [Telluria mixta]|uniref:Glycoside hydrolase family 13 protein n=1 Tax=Telluria mixta TaxID=34071 RepID=A0ABT2C064_9BURK|nr:glycoside hydrolase family 13 protein [Telluria mixta]MCS0630768.1 glycoside hydrolase family 13 protein [Telluria mixta]WEM98773.1 glycoside hydrolase family 13 protein [Telluria mixta]